MRHIGRVSKALPAQAALTPPTSIFDIRSWTDIILGLGLLLEKCHDWLFGTYLIPR